MRLSMSLLLAISACGGDPSPTDSGADSSTDLDAVNVDVGFSDSGSSDARASDVPVRDASGLDAVPRDASSDAIGVRSSSLAFYDRPGPDDYAQLLELPAEFGAGEFTFEMWIRPSGMGEYFGGDPDPASGDRWWANGNWFLDGHNNAGVPEAMRPGTFDLMFYGGGRVRWLLHDGDALYGVQANSSPALNDGEWHHLSVVRRFVDVGSSALELWVDGELTATRNASGRGDLRDYWQDWPGPSAQHGWFFGGEKMSATGSGGYRYDYDGLIADVRFWSTARVTGELSNYRDAISDEAPGLVGRFRFGEGEGESACDALDGSRCLTLVSREHETWSSATPPAE